MAKHDVSTGLYLVAMVGIVAVIGLVVLVMNSGSSATYSYGTEDLAGQGWVMPGAYTWGSTELQANTDRSGPEERVDPEEASPSDCLDCHRKCIMITNEEERERSEDGCTNMGCP